MSDEEREQNLEVLEESLGPDDPGSMAYKLANAGEKPEPEEVSLAEEPQTDGEPPEPPKPKYSTVEEYEKAYKEAETRMHTATQEATEARKAREALEAEMELTRKELGEVRAAQEASAAEAARAVPKASRKAIMDEVLKKVKAIHLSRDPDTGEVVYPDDYDSQVADAWADSLPDPEEIKRQVKEDLTKDFQRDRQAEDTRTAAERAEVERIQIRTDAEKLAVAQGLDMTPGSADYDLFYVRVNELAENPEHEYRDKPFEEQVKWATGRVRQVLGKKMEMTDAERAAAKRHQERNAVLERGVTRNTPAEPARQRTMQEILDHKALA